MIPGPSRTAVLAGSVSLGTLLVLQACASTTQEGTPSATPTPTAAAPAAPPPAPSPTPSPAAGERTVAQGVYTTAQSNRGETVFQTVCSACHGVQEFRGAGFQRIWNGRTVGDLYQIIATMMPLDNPGSLTPQQYTDIITFFLRQNGYATGQAEMPTNIGELRMIRFVPAGTAQAQP